VNPVSTAQGAGQNGSENFGMAFEGASGIPGGYINNASIQGQQNRSKVYYVDGIINTSVRAGSYVALPDVDSLQGSRSSPTATRRSSAASRAGSST
jgi:hypothetical protein